MNPTREWAVGELRRRVIEAIGAHEAEVWLFGSCARGDVRQHSDIDVAVLARRDLPAGFFAELREEIEKSEIPYDVDIVDLRHAAASLVERGPARGRQMEKLERRLAEVGAALATLDELAGKQERSLVERDGAVLRLIYSYEAVWKACQKILAALENVSAASPNATVRAARSLGWLADEDARAAIKLGEARNLVVHMYRVPVGAQIAGRLLEHAQLLHRWLDALRRRVAEADGSE